ncbi:MAG: type III-A CRISPR-associated protein Cas10/Csm1 [Candidatus Margulisbacteria bacterium]|nr:type III-A CRISPR-associated protein Cas10/Csm1 [Candidatus Margulisiibacteriota bacterium]
MIKKENNLDEHKKVVLAALLHDIGKFRQRTGLPLTVSDEFDYQNYLPEYNGKKSHYHAAHTGVALANINKNYFDIDGDVINIASTHHLSQTQFSFDKKLEPLYAIVKKADWLSSGLDRESSKKYEKSETDTNERFNVGQQDYKRARLESIFSQIKTDNQVQHIIKVCSLNKLSAKNSMPKDKAELSQQTAEAQYKLFWSDFEATLKGIDYSLKEINFNQFYLTMLTLLEKYTWCIPSSSYDVIPNVSLFDHLKTTTAFADALYLYHEDKKTLTYKNIMESNLAENKFLLIQGDFSGIQKFIFNIKGHSHAAKILRARSFFVSIATDIVAYKICKDIGLTPAGIVMNAGGKFTILAPNTGKTKIVINKIENEVNKRMSELTYGETRMNIAYVEAAEQDFFTHLDNVPMFFNKMNEINNALDEKKLKIIIDEDSAVFSNYLNSWTEKNQDTGACVSCNTNPKVKGDFCEQCSMMDSMGKQIIKAEYLSIGSEIEGFDLLLGYKINFVKDANAEYVFTLKSDETADGYPVKRYAGNLPVLTANDLNDDRFCGMTETQFDKNEFKEGYPKTFTHLAYQSLNEVTKQGKPFLGVIKADVDNLGYIFSKGFMDIKDKKEINELTFSKYASLSRMLDYYFTVVLIEEIKEKKLNIYTVFAGGDDLFLIGSWTDMFKVIKFIKKSFKSYVANNEGLHLSMGFALAKPSLPVPKIGELAEEQLLLSKNKGKNSFTMFNQTVNWDSFDLLMGVGEEIEKYKLSTQYLYRIIQFCEMSEGETPRDLMWKPMFHYVTNKNYGKRENMETRNYLLGVFDEQGKNSRDGFDKQIETWGKKLNIPLSKMLYEERD